MSLSLSSLLSVVSLHLSSVVAIVLRQLIDFHSCCYLKLSPCFQALEYCCSISSMLLQNLDSTIASVTAVK
jgi:hypothetical protein